MIALDNFDKKIREIETLAATYLDHQELEAYNTFSKEEIEAKLQRLLAAPIAEFSVVNTMYFRSKWGSLLKLISHEEPVAEV